MEKLPLLSIPPSTFLRTCQKTKSAHSSSFSRTMTTKRFLSPKRKSTWPCTLAKTLQFRPMTWIGSSLLLETNFISSLLRSRLSSHCRKKMKNQLRCLLRVSSGDLQTGNQSLKQLTRPLPPRPWLQQTKSKRKGRRVKSLLKEYLQLQLTLKKGSLPLDLRVRSMCLSLIMQQFIKRCNKHWETTSRVDSPRLTCGVDRITASISSVASLISLSSWCNRYCKTT